MTEPLTKVIELKLYPIEKSVDDGPVLSGWCTRQGHQTVLFFSHGNGFCSRVYEPLLELLAHQYDLLMFDLPGHGRSATSEFVSWHETAEYLYQALLLSEDFVAGRDVHAVGHSLGGMLSMMASSSHPHAFKSLVMLDPIMFPRSLLVFMQVVSKVGLTSVFHPFVKPTLRRRREWASREEAFDYFHNRKIFAGWTDPSLQSYVDHALKDRDDGQTGVRLCCEPAREAQWFGTLPERLWPSVLGLQRPVKLFMGQDSYPFALRAAKYAAKKSDNITYSIVPGGHCFMQQSSEQTANRVFAVLDEMA